MRRTLLSLAGLVLAGCATTPVEPPPSVPPVPPATLPPSTPPPPVPPIPPDSAWLTRAPEPSLAPTGNSRLDDYRRRLIEEGDPNWRPIFRRLLADVRYDAALIARHERMREIDTPSEYVAHYVTPERIAAGRKLYRELGGKDPSGDGTPLELKLALWGAASDYGARDDTDLINALMNLGAAGRLRTANAFPIHEAASLVVDRTLKREQLRGDDSGRMGDIQMTPDFYIRLRRDGDGDGFVDIWNNRSDILANLWIDRSSTDVPLLVAIKPFAVDDADPGSVRLARALGGGQAMAITYFSSWDGKPLPESLRHWTGVYHEPFGKKGPAFLISRAALLADYHRPYALYYEDDPSHGYALAIGLLAEAIAGRPIPDPATLSD